MAIMNCPECGKEMTDTLNNCPHCGFEITTSQQKKNKSKIIVPVICVLLAAVICFVAYSLKSKNESEWNGNCSTVALMMMTSCCELEEVSNTISEVWYNSIFQINDKDTNKYTMSKGVFYSDFNDAIEELFDDKKFSEKYSKIAEDKLEIDNYMYELKDCPNSCADKYELLSQLYDAYYEYYDSVTNIYGKTYKDFGKDFTKASKSFFKFWNKEYKNFSLTIEADD